MSFKKASASTQIVFFLVVGSYDPHTNDVPISRPIPPLNCCFYVSFSFRAHGGDDGLFARGSVRTR
jgi:hypothetical protein